MTEKPKDEIQIWTPMESFEGTDLVPELRPGTALVPEPPGGLLGRENTEPGDIILPALQLLQGQSDAITSGIEGAQPGKFYLSTSGEVMIPPLRILIVHHSVSRALFPKPDDSRSKDLKICLARDAIEGTEYGICENCDYRRWGPENQKPLCSRSHNFTAWTSQGPAVLRFANTSFKSARNFLTTWTMSSKNLWAHLALVTVKSNTKDLPGGKKSTYFTMDLRWDQREDVPPAFQESAVELYKQIHQAHEAGKLRTTDEDISFEE